jgi:hypothetical protein
MKPRPMLGLLAAAVVCAVASVRAAPALQGKKVLFVTGAPAAGEPSDDAAIRAHLEALGAAVTMAADTDPDSRAAGEDLVVISATVNPHVLRAGYRNAPVPVFTWSATSYPHLGMTGPLRHHDFEIIEPTQHFAESFTDLYGYCVNPNHPIARAAGLPAQMFGTLYLQPTESCWGRPGPGAQVVAVFEGNPDKAALFTYEKGSTLEDGAVAPARRVGFYLGRDNFHLLTAAYGPAARDPDQRTWYVGLKLFDAALAWAASPPPAPPAHDPAALHVALAQAAHGRKLLFVERVHGGEGREADEHNVEYLRNLGFIVTVADQDDPAAVAQGQAIVLISATCSKYKLTNKYRDVPVPLMCYEGLMADTLYFAGRDRYVDYGEHGEEKESDDPPESYLDIVNAWHPLAAGLSAGPVQVTKEPGTLKWATPSRGALVIATLPYAPQQCAIFGYDKGVPMAYDHVAPARRLLFPLDNPAFDELTPAGLALYDAALLWLLGPVGE